MSSIDEMRGSSKTLRKRIVDVKNLKKGSPLPKASGLRGEFYDLLDRLIAEEARYFYERAAQKVASERKGARRARKIRLTSAKSRNKWPAAGSVDRYLS